MAERDYDVLVRGTGVLWDYGDRKAVGVSGEERQAEFEASLRSRRQNPRRTTGSTTSTR
jgi:hypothetical protein